MPSGSDVKRTELEIRKDVDYIKKLKRARRVVFAVLGVSLGIFIAIAALAVLKEGIGVFLRTIYSINLFYYSLAFVVLFLGYLMRFPKWEMYLKALKVKVNRWDNLMIYFSMYSMDITPGRWGRGIVSYTLNKLTGTKFARTFPAVVADIFTDFIGFGMLAVISAFFVGKYIVVSLIITAVLLLPFVFLYHRKPFEYVKKKLSHIKSIASFFEVGTLYFKEKNRLGSREYIYSILFTFPSVVLTGLALYFVILAFGIHLALMYIPIVMFIYSSSLLFGIVTGVPATLGITDAALVSYLSLFFGNLGVTFGVASVITIFFRIVSVWFVQGFGSAALFHTMWHWNVRN